MSLPPWIYGVSAIASMRALRRNINDQPMEVEKEEPLTKEELEFIETIGSCPIVQIPYMISFGLGVAISLVNNYKNH